ncbi:MAG: HAMP domain-containing protein [Acidobacteriia bacterium]|nr:HAMP domain-containing protein [Terriglobia bacterium]
MPGRLRLHHRIVIPFALVALVATSGTAYVVLSVITRTLQARVETQILNAAALVSQSNFALNPAIIGSVKAITGADVVTFAPDGTILASTAAGPRASAVIQPILARQFTEDTAARPVVRHLDCAGVPCDAAYRAVVGRSQTVVAIVADTTELMAATSAVTRTVLVATVISLLVMVIVGQLVARRVTAPLDALVRFTRDVSGGEVHGRAPVGGDEVGRLGTAFNDMLDRLDRSREALVRSEKLGLAGLLAARVAHDIRNPLSSIKMQTQLLRAQRGGGAAGADDRNHEMIDAILRDIVQVESVIRDLLELARPGELNRRPASLNVVVQDVLEQLRPHLAYRKVEVDTRLAEGLPDIPLDSDRLKQALLNIINNAADAMPTGGTLIVATSRADRGSTIELDVCDDGIGVDPGILDRVFDPFVSTKRDGVGLGLVNAKAVVESHGGRVELAPRHPRGTRASLWLPIAEVTRG